MCGIAGFVGMGGSLEERGGWLLRMLGMLHHRGPDERGIFVDPWVGLATARLSIIDLKSGQQPMSVSDGRHWIAFNGEIFNYVELRTELEGLGHVFATTSDTEVLLRAVVQWDLAALQKLNGQFAFVIYDRVTGRVLAARDPFGERPLFYTRQRGGIAFASEIKALFALPFVERSIDVQAVQRVAHLWVSLPDETCFAGVRALPPGHYAAIQDGDMQVRPYYRLPFAMGSFEGDLPAAAEELRDRLRNSVRLRLRSDVPVGTYLSGGLDSSVTTYLAQRENAHPVRTFSVAFEDTDFDESSYQQVLSKHLGTQHEVVGISSEHLASAFSDALWHAETVVFRNAFVPMYLLSRRVRDAGIKVVLTGEGADEAFLGYEIFKETAFRAGYKDFPDDASRVGALKGMYPYLPHFDDAGARRMLPFYAQSLQETTPHLFSHELRFKNGLFATRLFVGPYDEQATLTSLSERLAAIAPRVDDLAPIEKAQLLEYVTLLAGYLLSSQGDRMSAANSIEGRCPFLDPDVVAFACSLPLEFRLRSGDEKHVIKSAFRDALPPAITARTKQPYRAPDARAFLSGKARSWVLDLTSDDPLRRSGIVEPTFAAQFFARVSALTPDRIAPKDDHCFIALLSALVLHERFIVGFPEAAPEHRPLAVRVLMNERGEPSR